MKSKIAKISYAAFILACVMAIAFIGYAGAVHGAAFALDTMIPAGITIILLALISVASADVDFVDCNNF